MADRERDELGRALGGGLFAPADRNATLGYGEELSYRTARSLLDPTRAIETWLEIGQAWFDLWRPFLGVAAGHLPADPRPIDLFISHARADEDRVAAFRRRLDALPGIVSFVDWIDNPERDRTDVNPQTADWLRRKLRQSHALVLLLSEESARSFWVQWELGFFDALRGHVFIVPLTTGARSAIADQQYYGLYPLIDTPDELVAALGAIAARRAGA
jgi:hypothetical protein